MTLICNDCGWRHTDFIPSEGKKPSVCSLVIDSSELMTTRVVRSSSCTVRIVELGLEVEPGDNATGYISNVEGVLGRFSDAISVILRSAMQDGDEREEQVKACQELIERIGRVKKGEESVKLLLLDPNGHSQILHESATSSELSEEVIEVKQLYRRSISGSNNAVDMDPFELAYTCLLYTSDAADE